MTRATLVTDGTSDRVLVEVLRWLCGALSPDPVELRWFDPRTAQGRLRTLRDRLEAAQELHPCELLFVHRDAESKPARTRRKEVTAANETGLPHVCVVPIRMTEAWLLIDEAAIRHAAGRPRGAEPLDLPALGRLEDLADPKARLHQLLRTASGARGRRAKQFDPARASHRVAELIDDWSPLRRLSAFQDLWRDTRAAFAMVGLRVSPPPPR